MTTTADDSNARAAPRGRAEDWFGLFTGPSAGATAAGEPGAGGGRTASGDATADAAGAVDLPVLSGSMRPGIPVGSTLCIRPAVWSATRDGDVVVFRRDGQLLAHRRLLGGQAGPLAFLYEKGDASARGGRLRPDDVVGLVVRVRLPDGTERDLRTPTERHRALRAARRSLAADLRGRLRALLAPGARRGG
ncbi:MAG: S24/S26 family peptidase [Candidatus Krumholzibacteriia bacterium]